MPGSHVRVQEIPIEKITVGEQKIRAEPEDESIGELAESIASKGLLQPIGVTTAPDGTYQLRWGHRRLLAHLRLNKTTIRATVYDGAEESIKGIALIENLHRQQMSITDEIEAVCYLANQEGKSIEQISTIVNKSRNWVLNRLMINDLPAFLKEPLLEGGLNFSQIEVICKVPDEGAQRYLATNCIINRWNKSQLKTIADCYMTTNQISQPSGTAIPGVPIGHPSQVFYYTCELCNQKDTLDTFTLVRVHKDGYGCRTTPDRPDQPGNSIDGMERDEHRHQRPDDEDQH